MRRLLVILAILPLTTGCQKLIKPVMKATGRASAGFNSPVTHKDIKVVIWGQSNAKAELGRMLGSRITTGDVLLYDYHIGSTSSYWWSLRPNHQALVDAVALHQPDYIFCVQGESDSQTPASAYYQNMAIVWEKLKLASPHSYRAQAMLGAGRGSGDPRGGHWLLRQAGLIHLGPDVEVYRTGDYTFDGTHFTTPGFTRIADKWLSIINGESYRYWDANNDRYFN